MIFESTIFVTGDVAVVYFLSALPVAALVAGSLRHRGRALRLAITGAAMAISLPLLASTSFESDLVLATIVRTLAAFGWAFAVTTLALMATRIASKQHGSRRHAAMGITIAILIATILPNLYIAARCRDDVRLLNELLAESRMGDAQTKARQLIRLAPSLKWRGMPLATVVRDIDRQVRALERDVAQPLTSHDPIDRRLRRARHLAMLGRTGDALGVLAPLSDSPIACDLAGTIYEATGQWEMARSFHQPAKEGWSQHEDLTARQSGAYRSATRLGYCERKLGRYKAAEVEYLEALKLSPTAETHFLVAQFYEDMQYSTQARHHARKAIELDSARYGAEGNKLINKLMLGHFGCAGVFTAESRGRLK